MKGIFWIIMDPFNQWISITTYIMTCLIRGVLSQVIARHAYFLGQTGLYQRFGPHPKPNLGKHPVLGESPFSEEGVFTGAICKDVL